MSAEGVGQGEVKEQWLAPSGPIHALVAQTGQENTALTLWGFISGKDGGGLGSEHIFTNQEC